MALVPPPPSKYSPTPIRLLPLPSTTSFPTCLCHSSSAGTVGDNTQLSSQAAQPLSSLASTAASASLDADIRRLCMSGDLDRALQLLDSSDGCRLDEDTYVALLRLCEWKRAVPQGARLYSHIASPSAAYPFATFSLRLGNYILGMFVRFGDLLAAWSVFGKMVERDLFSWNVMLGGYAKAGFLDEALDLYQRMLWAGTLPDVYTFPCVLRSCAGLPDLVRGREVHAHVFRFGFAAEIDVLNALLTMYAKCGDLDTARKVFDGMPRRDCISWNAMIAGYFENDDLIKGMELFLVMLECGSLEPDLMTMTSVISASGLLDKISLGKEIHGFAIKRGFANDLSVSNSLIQMYCSIGNLEEAEKMFSFLEIKDVVSWTAMISGYDKNASPHKALELFEQMEANNVIPDEVTVASVLSVCACLGRLDIGIKLHKLARTMGLTPCTLVSNTLLDMYSKSRCMDKAIEVFRRMPQKNVISWSSIILGFTINRRSFEALSLFRQMQINVKPNSITFISALSACAAIGALMCGKELHAQALRVGLVSEGYVPNALLDLYVKCGQLDYAWMQFNALEEKDVVSWNIMLSGHAGKGHGNLAISLFDRMVQAGIYPDEVTFVALLCAFSRSGMVNEGWNYFLNMNKKYSVNPNLKHYACMVDLLGRAGYLEQAHQFIKEMPIKPDAAIWGALLNGCRIHHNVEFGELAARHIFEIDTTSVGYYVLLCNLYADDGQWDQVARVRKVMRERGLEADPGCSWVEVKGAVHAFLTSDESHPQIKEIYAMLNGLFDRIRGAGFVLPEDQCEDDIEVYKADVFCGHSERLAVVFGLINTAPGMPISVTKNLYMCRSCHSTIKMISKVVRRDITVRDTEQFHHFKDGSCSCKDEGYWKG